jgi:hypothetical protein
MAEKETPPGDEKRTSWLAVGIGLGLPFGLIFGLIAFDNPALGIGFGLALGVAFGVAMDNRKNQP